MNLAKLPPDLCRIKAQKRLEWAALRLVEAGQSFGQAVTETGITHALLEHALVTAKRRQETIRSHLQMRPRLTSILRYPDRGPWGHSHYFGNCSGFLLVDLFNYFTPRSVFDPMEGSGTVGEVCFDFQIDYEGWDLQEGVDLLSRPLPERHFDLVFWHPPYWPGQRYSKHPNDFSSLKSVNEYLTALHAGFTKLITCVSEKGHLVVLIGDGRKQGVFYPVHSQIIQWGLLPLEAVLVKEGDHNRRAQFYKYGPSPFIPTLHEYVLIFKKGTT